MTVRDASGRVLAEKAVPVRGLLRQALGLMFRGPLGRDAWVFAFPWEARWDLTNLFVLQDIDAVWLDAQRRVLQVRTLRRWQYKECGAVGTRYVIELGAGVAKGVRVGERLSWRF